MLRPDVSSDASQVEIPPIDWRTLAVVLTVVLLLASYRQPDWPATWFDEGFVTAGAESLAVHGRYALRSSEGWRTLDQPLVANGPGIVIPVAIALRLLGAGLWQARVVAIVFMVLAGLLVYVLAHRLAGPVAGALALAVTLVMPREGFMYFGRMAMGNVPALAYFLAGGLAWMTAIERRAQRWAWAAGLLFGVAAITKAQWSVVLPPALLLVWVIDRVAVRAIGGKLIAAAAAGSLAVMAAWYVARLVISGPDGFVLDLMRVQESAHSTVFALNPARYLVRSGQYLLKSGIAFVMSAGLLYAGVLVARREEGAKQAVLFASVLLVWLAWYAVVSVGWERYAFEPTVIGAVLAGAGLAAGPRLARQPTRRMTRIAAAVVASVLAVAVLLHSFNRARDLLGPPDDATPAIAAYLNQHVDPRAVVESWEWQLSVMTDTNFHYPTNDWVDRFTAERFGGVPVDMPYPVFDADPEYLVDGPFSKFTGLYAPALAAGCCELLARRGPYDVYQVRPRRHAGTFSRLHPAPSDTATPPPTLVVP